MVEKILVTGAFGQIGSELVPQLQEKFGQANIIALDIKEKPQALDVESIKGDIQDKELIESLLEKHQITQIYHLASLLSASGEKNPDLAWALNMKGLKNVLDLAKKRKLRVFWPSSIAVFGIETPKQKTPEHTIIEPTTMYGITKYTGELLCRYYNEKFDVDVRSVRYPGIISWKAPPGGGTTDYAVAMFYEALGSKQYSCFVTKETMLPMMYMDDAIRATIELMDTPRENITTKMSYNLAAISFTAEELAKEIQKHVPDFEVTYDPDERQSIADSWPQSIDDQDARKEWGWKHEFDLQKLAEEMLDKLRIKLDVDNGKGQISGSAQARA